MRGIWLVMKGTGCGIVRSQVVLEVGDESKSF